MIVIVIRFRDDRDSHRESKLSFKLWNFQLILLSVLSTVDSRAFYVNGQPNEWVTNDFCKKKKWFRPFLTLFFDVSNKNLQHAIKWFHYNHCKDAKKSFPS